MVRVKYFYIREREHHSDAI